MTWCQIGTRSSAASILTMICILFVAEQSFQRPKSNEYEGYFFESGPLVQPELYQS